MDRRRYCTLIGSAGVAAMGSLLSCTHPGRDSTEPASRELPEWAMGPFVKHGTPVLKPNAESVFQCPISQKEVRWEEQNVYNPAAVVRDGRVYLLYRGDDIVPGEAWGRTCRTGLATSPDGISFERSPVPVIYPDNDPYKQYEWVGGTEDIHIVEEGDTYYVNYTAWNGKTDAIIVAGSEDLYSWTKHGPAFGEKTDDPAIRDRTGVVVSKLEDGKLVAARVNGSYWMYYGLQSAVATSDNLIDWTPLMDAAGHPVQVMEARPGFFDSGLCEAGAIALLTDDGIVLFYNAYNESADEDGDPRYPQGWSGLGQALLDREDPVRLVDRLDRPFLHAELDWEVSGFIENAVVSNALVYFNREWLLYYGAADRRIGMARFRPGK